MRRILILSFGFLGACASTQTTSQTEEAQTVRVSSTAGSGAIRTGMSALATKVDTLWVSLDRVWRTLPSVYGLAEIPISDFDAEKNVIGNSGFKMYRRLGKTSLSKYFDCGSTQVGPSAESYEIHASILTRVHRVASDTAKTVVTTTVDAVARPMQFAGEYRRCTSKGALEQHLSNVLLAQFAK
jgi:hypothetical protein